MSFHPSRRSLLQGAGLLAAGVLAVAPGDVASASVTNRLKFPRRAFAPWVSAENARTGDATWLQGHPAPAGVLEGYAAATSVQLGGRLAFFVSTTVAQFQAKVYRMGYYQGAGARLVETKANLRGRQQPMPSPDQFGTVDCTWPVTFNLDINDTYLPGQYLVRLENAKHQYSFIPFVVRDDGSQATYMYMSSVTTWQAYNTWGGFSLYREDTPLGTSVISNAARAVRVSFNRPYARDFANGAADFIGNEFPLLFLLEHMGLDLAYSTDVDLHERGQLLLNHRALLSLGHDEYYSPAMRRAVTNALARGVNVAFFGANFCYRKIRFEPGVNGADRLMINYRSTADPITASNPSLSTVNWSQYPSNLPSSTFSGSNYGGVAGVGSLTVSDASAWLWRGAGLTNGAVLPGALGGEFNQFKPLTLNPTSVQILAHSSVAGGMSDVTYAAPAGQGGVFSSGTGMWIYHLSNAPRLGGGQIPAAMANVTVPLTIATSNVLALFAGGPAGTTLPSVDNTAQFYG